MLFSFDVKDTVYCVCFIDVEGEIVGGGECGGGHRGDAGNEECGVSWLRC